MNRSSAFACLFSLAVGTGVFAGGIDWEFTAPGGMIVDNNINFYPITLDDPMAPGKSVPFIASMELELNGLSHTFPADLDIYLVDPMLNSIKIMTDRGGATPISNFNLIFRDGGAALPVGALVNNSIYRTEGASAMPPDDMGFADFVGQSGGQAPARWLLLIIDDAVGDSGSLGSFTLRGTVPEPTTLSLLALGAIAALRRKKR